jgi:hypothetical protein
VIDGVEIRPADARDAPAILASFNRVFREVCGEGYVDRTLPQWRWLYERNPAGRRIHVAITADGTVAAHYGGLPCAVDSPFGACVFVQGVDSYVLPEWRGLRKTGLFVATAEAWFAAAERQHGDAVIYGYPVPAAARVGQRCLGYTDIRVVDYLTLDSLTLDPAAAPAVPSGVEVRAIPSLAGGIAAEVDALADALPAEWIRFRRDARYLRWRYLDAPDAPYELYGAWAGGRLAGVAALRPQHELVPGACTIADWLVPPADEAAGVALIAAAARRARAAQRARLLAVFADWAPEHALLRRLRFSITPSAQWLERRLMHRTFAEAYTTAVLAAQWWYTLGDSDLV